MNTDDTYTIMALPEGGYTVLMGYRPHEVATYLAAFSDLNKALDFVGNKLSRRERDRAAALAQGLAS